MGSADGGVYGFRCPECDELLEVNAVMRDVLIERGCVVCGSPVTREAFTVGGSS